jgi:serine/threonine protein kinase
VERLTGEDPKRLGHFELVCRLSAGGMAQVYLATAPDGRFVAVKVLHSSYGADARFRTRFGREVQTLRGLHSSWTVNVLGADPEAARPWLATEYLAAPTLDELVGESGCITGGALTTLAGGLAAALAELHAQNVLHRDLKPSNVMLTVKGPRLIDFGIARALDASRLTQTGMVVGTPAYSSPEQALGQPESPASDVFSMALVIGYAATGVGPFGRSENAVVMLRRIVDDEPKLDELPEPLRAELARCLAKDPSARPSAAELANRLAVQVGLAGVSHWPPSSVRAQIERKQREMHASVRFRSGQSPELGRPPGPVPVPVPPGPPSGSWPGFGPSQGRPNGSGGQPSGPGGRPSGPGVPAGARPGAPGPGWSGWPPQSPVGPGSGRHPGPPYGPPPPSRRPGSRTWLIVALVLAGMLVLASMVTGALVLLNHPS